MYLRRLFKKGVLFVQYLLVLSFVVFEELVWERLARPLYKALESEFFRPVRKKISSLPLWALVLLFMSTLSLAESLGIVAGIVFFFSLIAGIFLYVLKIVFAGVAIWIFNDNKDSFLKIEFIAKGYGFVIRVKSFIESTEIYKDIKKKASFVKSWISGKKGALKRLYRLARGKIKRHP